MDIFSSGPNTGNLLVVGLVAVLLVLSSRAKMLDKTGSNTAAVLGLVVGGLGHWTWLLILLGFLLSSHKATKWRFDEKKALGLSESSDGHRGWTNVVANGAIPGLICVYAYLSDDWNTVVWLFGAAVAVAASDTFASEIGCLDSRVRMITTFKPCEQEKTAVSRPTDSWPPPQVRPLWRCSRSLHGGAPARTRRRSTALSFSPFYRSSGGSAVKSTATSVHCSKIEAT